MRQKDAQIGKIMSTELKSQQYKQQMTFSDSEINSNAASLFSNVFFTEFFSFIQQQLLYCSFLTFWSRVGLRGFRFLSPKLPLLEQRR